MSTDDWTPEHVAAALAKVGWEHLNDATVVILQCPQRHTLGRLVATPDGPVWISTHRPHRLPAAGRRNLRERDQLPQVGRVEMAVLFTPAYLTAADAVGFEERLEIHCRCGIWLIGHRYLIELAENPPPRPKGVPRQPVDTSRVEFRASHG